jgi:hypothetical protein
VIPVEDGTLGRGLRLLPDADDEWFADGQWDDGGVALWVDGVDRGHLFTRHPERLRDAALQRLASVLEASAPLGEPLAVLHHGSGTFALARYVAATRPDSKQLLIDVDPDSTRLVAESWPLPRCAVRVTPHRDPGSSSPHRGPSSTSWCSICRWARCRRT